MGSIGHRLRVNRYTEENERKLTIKRRLIYDGLSLAWMNEWKGSRSALSAGGGGEEKCTNQSDVILFHGANASNFMNVIHYETTTIFI